MGDDVRTSATTPVATELLRRTAWLIRLRWFAVIGIVCAVEVSRRLLDLRPDVVPIYAIAAGLAAANAFYRLGVQRFVRNRRLAAPSRPNAFARLLVPRTYWVLEAPEALFGPAVFAMSQIFIDQLALAAVIHYAGGIENPFVYVVIVHIIVASILLSRRFTWVAAATGLLLIATVASLEAGGVLAHTALGGPWDAPMYADTAQVVGQLLALASIVFVVTFVSTTITVHLREAWRNTLLLTGELREKAEALQRAYEAVSLSEQAKSSYMRKVAHELRGPLGTIETSLKVVLQGMTGELSEQARDLISRAQRRAGDLAALTLDLLTLSRAKEADISSKMATIRPADLVRDVVADTRGEADRAGVRVTTEIDPATEQEYRADPKGLRQLVENLVRNAIRYNNPGGRVSVALRPVNGRLRLDVEDTGMGIAEPDLSRVFDEFFRADNARARTPEGTGLGLAIVKAVADRHGGSISISSTVGSGTRIEVELPLAQERP